MSQAQHENQIDYVEMSVTDIATSKQFYGTVFGWKFEDYGPEYTSFFDGRLALLHDGTAHAGARSVVSNLRSGPRCFTEEDQRCRRQDRQRYLFFSGREAISLRGS